MTGGVVGDAGAVATTVSDAPSGDTVIRMEVSFLGHFREAARVAAEAGAVDPQFAPKREGVRPSDVVAVGAAAR